MSIQEMDRELGSPIREQSARETTFPVAGPSRISPPPTTEQRPTTSRRKQAGLATYRHLPKTAYGSIEYPGPVSHASAITDLSSQDDIDTCFNAPSGDNSLLESHYRKDRMGAPVRGYRVSSQKLLVKVVKRKRKDGKGGVFTTEVVGPINQTVRFRCKSNFDLCTLASSGYLFLFETSMLNRHSLVASLSQTCHLCLRYSGSSTFTPTPILIPRSLPLSNILDLWT